MRRALLEYTITGINTNIAYHLAVLHDADFAAGRYTTHFIEEHPGLMEAAGAYEEERLSFADKSRRASAAGESTTPAGVS